jgi:hypothetical protein
MLQTKNSISKDSAHFALIRNALASAEINSLRGIPKPPEVCQRCGLVRAVHSTIVVHCIEGRTVEAPLCGRCTREVGR